MSINNYLFIKRISFSKFIIYILIYLKANFAPELEHFLILGFSMFLFFFLGY